MHGTVFIILFRKYEKWINLSDKINYINLKYFQNNKIVCQKCIKY